MTVIDEQADIDVEAGGGVPFVALIAVESDERLGEGNAGDARVFPSGVFSWRDPETQQGTIHTLTTIPGWGHDGADVSGHVDVYKRLPSADAGLRALFGDVPGDFAVVARGAFDSGAVGTDTARMIAERTLAGVSVDPGSDLDVQERCTEMEVDDFGPYCVQWEARFLRYQIAGFTIVDVPGIAATTIRLATPEDLAAFDELGDVGPGEGAEAVDEDETIDGDDTEDDGELVAASAMTAAALLGERAVPTVGYFTRPEPDRLTAFTVGEPDADGWVPVYGHVAPAEGSGVCHIGYSGCKEAPPSPTDYAAGFNLGAFPTSDGDVSVGRITMGTGHAPLRLGRRPLSAQEAIGHYDHNGFVAAYVHASNGQHGWWVAGVVRPSLTADQLLDLKAGSLSGDWRPIGTALEGVAALVVNVPGFPIPRTEALVASGRPAALVATGIVLSGDCDSGTRRSGDDGRDGVAARLDRIEEGQARLLAALDEDEWSAMSAAVRGHGDAELALAELRVRRT